MQLCIENVDQSGGCSYGYSCTYTDSISWASPSQPLPMVRDPRVVFDSLFGVGATPGERRERRAEDKSLLDWLSTSVGQLKKELGAADRARLSDYLDEVREVERRIQKVEAYNSSGERARAAQRADRRARFVLRARQADVRPAGARLRIGPHARVRVQARTRRVEPHLSGERVQRRVPLDVAPRRAREHASWTSRRSTCTTSA